ncbi:MAG: glycerol-3-phosphate cytidylyltransferase [Acidimicrobiaceae bacterium]|jgi:glycerol-3-phosphate cytidylyltransferase/D-beta-D-heptose 7-phosphate kinase/D-beta-D-heptose 1-phosphate adenosyltransferase|nr:glycerol-3-phosphate cytidylyltransferase [Acidimicrobiaceae bacterium]
MCLALRILELNLIDGESGADSRPVLVIVSGYFSPLHCGHLDYLEEAAASGNRLIVIVNNNDQQILKKGKLIMDQKDRLRIINALSIVDDAMISIDDDRSVSKTLAFIAENNKEFSLVFGNGGDRNSLENIPEGKICEKYEIKTIFNFGGTAKRDSSTRINQELGVEE